jgi:hypothetical protein
MNTNYGQTIFYLCFLFAELPSQLISKKLGPDNWIPIQMVSWSLVASLQAFLTGKSSFYACRALLGLIEGGFIPDNILYLSYFYTGWELPARLSWFWVSYQSTQIISAFFAFGILRLRGYNGMEGWRWLFALEGTLTGIIGIISWFYLPPSPTQTASKSNWNIFRGKDGWFNEREEKIMVNRILRDDPSKGDMHNRQGLSFRMFGECLADYHMWPIYLLGLSWLIPSTPMTSYLTLQLRSLGFGTFETNLLTVSHVDGPENYGAHMITDTRLRALHPPTSLLDLAFRTSQRAFPCRIDVANLGSATSHRFGVSPEGRLTLATLDAFNFTRWPSLCTCHSRSHHLPERRNRAHTHCRLRAV